MAYRPGGEGCQFPLFLGPFAFENQSVTTLSNCMETGRGMGGHGERGRTSRVEGSWGMWGGGGAPACDGKRTTIGVCGLVFRLKSRVFNWRVGGCGWVDKKEK